MKLRAILFALVVVSPSVSLGGPAERVTFADVHPILQQRCNGCHQAGEIAPMAFSSYAKTRPWAKAIREAVLQRTMPPWSADVETSRRIRNSRMLTDAQRKLLVSWVDGGAPEGSPVQPDAGTGHAAGWRLGKPDFTVRVPGYRIPANGTLQYTFLVTPTHFEQDQWIAAAEWKIDQRAMVHHINAFVRPPGSSYVKAAPLNQLYVASTTERAARRSDESEVDRRELLVGYEPGYIPAPWGEDRAKLIRKGSDIVFEIHFTANGTEAVDHSELGIYFAKRPPAERVLTLSPADSKLAIPPGDSNYESRARATFTSDVKLVSLQPHMHLRGKSYNIAMTKPDGTRDELLRVPRYDFNWQTTYFLYDPIPLPKGTVLDFTARFDNSANNKFNPDPSKTVYWGDQSWEEMNIGFIEVAFPATANPTVAILSDTSKPAGLPQKKAEQSK